MVTTTSTSAAFSITQVLNDWANMGVFAYLLPFLMIFAVVFGILNKTKLLGDNKGVQATIALTIGLLSLQFDYVANFFAVIFPYTGMGIAVLLIALILMGLAADQSWSPYVWFWTGMIIFGVILLTSLSDIQWWGSGFGLANSFPMVVLGVILIVFIALIIWGDRIAKIAQSGGH